MAKSSGVSRSNDRSAGTGKTVSSARLNQKSGIGSSFGGYTKVNLGKGNFTMEKTSGK
jgi:hypothetical protein